MDKNKDTTDMNTSTSKVVDYFIERPKALLFIVLCLLIIGKVVFGGPNYGILKHSMRNNVVTASYYNKWGWGKSVVVDDICKEIYRMSRKYKSANTLKLEIQFGYTNSYGEGKKQNLGTFNVKLSDARKFKSKSSYMYNSDNRLSVELFIYNAGFK
ncbi:MAG: hypothetical protein HOD63_10120 [Bacteroidetes bacterium]|jgi:hypothetical protein|nr:hypothetical protein [Bacteroidota bacterium]